MVRLLLTNGATVNMHDKAGFTPLLCTVQGNHTSIASALLAAGSQAGQGNSQGVTPLILAVHSGNVPLVKLLLARSADVNARTVQGVTAVNYTAGQKPLVAKSLLALLLPRMAKAPDDPTKDAPLVPMAPGPPQMPQSASSVSSLPSIFEPDILHLPTGASVPAATGIPHALGQP